MGHAEARLLESPELAARSQALLGELLGSGVACVAMLDGGADLTNAAAAYQAWFGGTPEAAKRAFAHEAAHAPGSAATGGRRAAAQAPQRAQPQQPQLPPAHGRGYVSLPAKELFEVVLDHNLPRAVPQPLLAPTQLCWRCTTPRWAC